MESEEPFEKAFGRFLAGFRDIFDRQWTKIYNGLSKAIQREQNVLQGAIQIKTASKALEKLSADGAIQETLHKCQRILKDAILGMLEVTYPAMEELSASGFAEDGFTELNGYWDQVVEWALKLEGLFEKHEIEPAVAPVETAENLQPELLQMLQNATAGNSQGAGSICNKEQSQERKQWQAGDGRLSALLDAEIFEVPDS